MKKLLCAAFVCALLAAAAIVPVGASQTNVEVSAQRFARAPAIDGSITENEWGEPTFTVNAIDAATSGWSGPNVYNTYIGFVGEGKVTELFRSEMSLKCWLRWDDERFYVAVKVRDPDGHSAKNGAPKIWDNDCIQFRVDPQGPDSAQKARDPSFNWKTDAWDYVSGTSDSYGFNRDLGIVWSNTEKLINTCFAINDGGSYSEANWDFFLESALPGAQFRGTTRDLSGDLKDYDYTCETNYEISIPWSSIGNRVYGSGWSPRAGQHLGMTIAVINASAGSLHAESFFTWGCGVCGGQGAQARQTCGGTNAVLLSNDTVGSVSAVDAPETKDGEPKTTESESIAKVDEPVTEADVGSDGTADGEDVIVLGDSDSNSETDGTETERSKKKRKSEEDDEDEETKPSNSSNETLKRLFIAGLAFLIFAIAAVVVTVIVTVHKTKKENRR